MGQLLRTKRHTATGKQSQVLVAAVNHHMPATPAWGNQASRIGMDSRLVWLLVQALTMSVEAKITKVITCRSLSDRTNR
jgi:hypothetical protein